MSAGGLTRRRGAGAGQTATDENDEGSSRVLSPTPRPDMRSRDVSYDTVNGHKVAYDPRDISESEERVKQPKLTLMEEVLLLGLKDKQVLALHKLLLSSSSSCEQGSTIVLE